MRTQDVRDGRSVLRRSSRAGRVRRLRSAIRRHPQQIPLGEFAAARARRRRGRARMTITRSQTSTSSSASVEASRIALALVAPARTRSRLISRAGADIDAARRVDQDEDAGVGGQPAADLHLLLVAARQRPHLGVDRRRLDVQARRPGRAPAAARRRRRATPLRATVSRLAMPILSATDWSRDQAVAAVLRHQPEAERNRLGRGCRSTTSAPSTRIVALAPAGPGAVDRERRLDAAGAEQAEQPDDLALARRRDRGRRHAQSCHPARRRRRPVTSSAARPARRGCARRRRAGRRRRPSRATIVCARYVAGAMVAADAAVAHDDDAVGDREDLGQPMRDEDDRDAARLQRAHAVEQPLRLAFGQRRGRLVEDQQPRILGQARARSRRAAGVARSSDDIGASGSTSSAEVRQAPLWRARMASRRRRACRSASARR